MNRSQISVLVGMGLVIVVLCVLLVVLSVTTDRFSSFFPVEPQAASGLVSLTPAADAAAAGREATSRPPGLMVQAQAGEGDHPTLADFWDGQAVFELELKDTGLPMGESDTIVMSNGEFWSYLHASQRSAGAVDPCGHPVPFPGCVVIYRSYDGGYHFYREEPPVCQFECRSCPCDSAVDHVDQQQYPRVIYDGETLYLVYEYRARTMLRRSQDGLNWSPAQELPFSGMWTYDIRDCSRAEKVREHPFAPHDYDCLAGGPPGLWVNDGELIVFVGVGQNPGGMGCYAGAVGEPVVNLGKCRANPLFKGAVEYGPLDAVGVQANPYFDFRTISSAEVQLVGDQYYMLFEGIRGPGSGDPGDTQFGLGLARSRGNRANGHWEKYPHNPILVDLPGNIGLGHADLVVDEGQTLLYTSLDGKVRSRLRLVWK